MSIKRIFRNLVENFFFKLPNKKGIIFLLNLQRRLYFFTLGIIKLDEMKNFKIINPRHRLTSINDFFIKKISRDERILDVGCGTGFTANLVADKAKFVLGIDIRKNIVYNCNKVYRKENLKFQSKDLVDFNKDDNFDTIIIGNVLEHIDDRKAFLKQCSKVAKKILITVPAFDRDWIVPYQKELGVEWRKNTDHRLEYTNDILLKELEESNYEVDEIYSRWGNYFCHATSKEY